MVFRQQFHLVLNLLLYQKKYLNLKDGIWWDG